MFRQSLLGFAVAALFAGQPQASGQAQVINTNNARSTMLTVYTDKTLVRQQFGLPDMGQSVITLQGLSPDWQADSLELDFRNDRGSFTPQKVWWNRGGLDRDTLYRKLVGKPVELLGGGLNVAVQGTMLTYDHGLALVQGNNGRQYLVDMQDPQGFRLVARETAFDEEDYQPRLQADFGDQTPAGDLRLAYVTPSVRYSSHYRLTLEEDSKARLELNALLNNNSDIDYSNVRVRLVSGDSSALPGFARKEVMMDMAAQAAPGNQSQRVGEVLVSSLPETTILPPYSSQQVSLYNESQLELEKVYVLDVYGRSYAGRGPALERPRLSYRFKVNNDLPAGQVRLFEEGPDGGLVISGNAWMPRTTAGDMARLTMGEAQAVRVERHRLDSQQKAGNELFVQWQTTVYNDRRDEIVLLLADRDRNLLKLENVTGAGLESTFVIRITVPPESKKTISYSSLYSR